MLRASAGLLPLAVVVAVASGGCQSGNIGDPCVPEEEYIEGFAGFKLTEENIESRSFQCASRICLVNHFQGRVSCPQGQPTPLLCDPQNGDSDCATDVGTSCQQAGQIATDCDPTPCSEPNANQSRCNQPDGTNEQCGGAVCNASSHFCECDPDNCSNGSCCPENYSCDAQSRLCTTHVCSKQQNDLGPEEQRCYVPGTDIPVSVPVCAQCSAESKRTAEDAVYCSCRCGVAEGQPDEPNFNFCDCPEGFICEEIRPYLGLGDRQLSGKYCIKQGTAFVDPSACGAVQGWWGGQCGGTGS